jgi:DNA-binding NtrC family response regulator
MVRTLGGVLRLHGWSVTAAYSGEEAIQSASEGSFAAVLMDVRMPGMTGADAFRAIRRAKPHLPVILMTAYAAHELIAQAERDGVLMVLPKPVPIARVTETLAQLAQDGPILVVDDDREFLDTLEAVLVTRYPTVLKAASLEEALAQLARRDPVAVIMDLKLNGLEPDHALVAINRLSPEVLLILYSGHPALLDETVGALPADRIHATLRKPFPPERLLHLLHAAQHR